MLAMQPHVAPGLGGFAVDEGWNVHLDPAAVQDWTPSQLGFVLNHVAQHLLRSHADRARAFGVTHEERLAWNMAADAEINDDLAREISPQDRRLLKPLIPKQLDLEPGKLAEYYFTKLRGSNPSVPDEGSGVHGQRGSGESGESGEPDESDQPDESQGSGVGSEEPAVSEMEAEALRQLTADAIEDYEAGQVPAGLARWAQARLGRSADWRSLLTTSLRQQTALSAGLADYSYRRLSRRARAVPNVVLPAMVKLPVDIAIVIDTSGSVRDADLGDALRETRAIAARVGSTGGSVQVVACDATATRIPEGPAAAMALTGGGGTNMAAGIEAALDGPKPPQAVVVLTDGFTPWPDVEPGVPVIIGLIGRRRNKETPSWATTIEIEPGAH